MGIFSGILLCTDFDGTLATGAKIVDSNREAIEYFKNNGGSFSLITGRNLRFAKEQAEADTLFNTYIGCLNGMLIYDPLNKKIVSETFLNGDIRTPIMSIRELYTDGTSQLFIVGRKIVQLGFDDPDFVYKVDAALSAPAYKLYAYLGHEISKDELERLSKIFGEEFSLSLSSSHGLEIQNTGFDKGFAAKQLSQLTQAELLVCVGDYGNDVPMLKAADVSYAVGNAPNELKAIADHVTADCRDGAVAAVIRHLEQIKNKMI